MMTSAYQSRLAVYGALDLFASNVSATASPQIGILTCDPPDGLSISVICDFRRDGAPPETYFAVIEEFDPKAEAADDGYIAWAVSTRASEVPTGALAGDYTRTKGKALTGGHTQAFRLQPVQAPEYRGNNWAKAIFRVALTASN